MKKQRQKLLMDFNDDAGLDKEQYVQLQKKIFSKQIDFKIRNDTVTNKQFSIKPLDIEFLQSTAIKDEPKFKEIKKIMTDYNKHAQQMGEIVEDSHLQTKVMNSLQKFMRLMMLAPDTQTKKTILNISYHWMKQHLDPKSKRMNQEEVLQEIKDVLIKKALVPIDIINKELINTRVNDQLKFYRQKARTAYNELDAPKYQLANYHTHKLEFMSEKPENKPETSKKWIDTVKFPKVQLPGYYIQEQPDPVENDENDIDKEIEKKQGNQENKPENAGENIQTAPTQGNLQTKQAQQEGADQAQDLDFGAPNDDQPGQPEEVEQLEDKKRGKLDPLVKVFLLERIKAKEKGEVKCQKKFLQTNNRINRTHEEQFDEVKYISEWAKQRTRFKTQANRKNQSLRILNKISNSVRKQERTYDCYLESDLGKLKVKRELHENLKNISKIDPPPEKLNYEVSNSIFDRRRIKTQYANKPFSSILADNDYTKERNSMLEEIGGLKQKFAKAKIYTPMDNIVKGLINPVVDRDPQDFQTASQRLIWPNSHLLSNPFMKVAKKKKKKKKK